ncbi:MAG: hypothetical protein DBX05_03840 [Candidatus Poseidoniales archaeon]|nr:MAG: hypothetical protein CBE15_07055 [Euryarchaeota archaeon TMED255]RAH11526.1 MAG: hypothetical protein CMA23_002130 [Euryarchaeota archaeon]RCH73653.1 MAG: hypothetical protein DBX05_03840 [Candidatus Poseidoniales archaeon]
MGVLSVVWRVHSSGLDDIKIVRHALDNLTGEGMESKEDVGRSWHGSPQVEFERRTRKKSKSRESLARMGTKALSGLMDEDVSLRIDGNNIFHLRLSLADLCCGIVKITDPRRRLPCIKGEFKIEVYPGQDVLEVAKNVLQRAYDQALRNNWNHSAIDTE